MMARFTTLCGCEQVKNIGGSQSSIPGFFRLPFTNKRANFKVGADMTVVRENVTWREFELMRFGRDGVAEYLEVER